MQSGVKNPPFFASDVLENVDELRRKIYLWQPGVTDGIKELIATYEKPVLWTMCAAIECGQKLTSYFTDQGNTSVRSNPVWATLSRLLSMW